MAFSRARRLCAGGRRIRTSGPALAKGSVGVIEGRWRTDRPGWRSLSPGALARRRGRARAPSLRPFLSQRDRKFESSSLQPRVSCEPDFLALSTASRSRIPPRRPVLPRPPDGGTVLPTGEPSPRRARRPDARYGGGRGASARLHPCGVVNAALSPRSLAERRRDVEQAVAPSQHHHDCEFAESRLVAICIAQGDASAAKRHRRRPFRQAAPGSRGRVRLVTAPPSSPLNSAAADEEARLSRKVANNHTGIEIARLRWARELRDLCCIQPRRITYRRDSANPTGIGAAHFFNISLRMPRQTCASRSNIYPIGW